MRNIKIPIGAQWYIVWSYTKCTELKSGDVVYYRKIGHRLEYWHIKNKKWTTSKFTEIPRERSLGGICLIRENTIQ